MLENINKCQKCKASYDTTRLYVNSSFFSGGLTISCAKCLIEHSKKLIRTSPNEYLTQFRPLFIEGNAIISHRLWAHTPHLYQDKFAEWMAKAETDETIRQYVELPPVAKPTAQEICIELSIIQDSGLYKSMAARYSGEPVLAEKFIKELYEQTLTNRDRCISAWSEKVVVKLETYFK